MPSDTHGSPFLLSFRSFKGLLLLLAGLGAIFFLVEAVRFLPVVGDNMYPEAANMVVAQRWAHGFPLFTDFRLPPYLLTGFPPLWYAALSLAVKVGISDVDRLTLFGRLLSMASLLLTVLLAYAWNRRRGFATSLSLLSPLVYLSFPILIPWAVTARPDFPTLLCSFLAVFLIGNWPGQRGAVLAGVAAAAAFLMKQSSVAAPAAIGLWLLTSRRWKALILFCLTWGLLVGGTYGGFQFASKGMMTLNLSPNHFGATAVSNAHQILVQLLTPAGSGFAVILLAFGALGFFAGWTDADHRDHLLSWYLITSMGFAVLGSMVAGGNANYYLEPGLVWALLLCVALEALRRNWPQSSLVSGLSFLLILAVLLPSLDIQRWKMFGEQPPNFSRAAQLVAGHRVLTDVPYLGARSLEPEFLDPVSYAYVEKAERWLPQSILQDLQTRQYEFVVLHRDLEDPYWKSTRYPRLGPAVRKAVAGNYGFCFELDSLYVYGPLTGGGGSAPTCPREPGATSPGS